MAEISSAPATHAPPGLYTRHSIVDVHSPVTSGVDHPNRHNREVERVLLRAAREIGGGLDARTGSSTGSVGAQGSSSTSVESTRGPTRSQRKKLAANPYNKGKGRGKGKGNQATERVEAPPFGDKYRDTDDSEFAKYTPPAIPVWRAACLDVDTRPELLEPNRPREKLGHRYPDPGLFIGSSKRGLYLVNWLASRSAWLYKMVNSEDDDASAGNQLWRDFLGYNYSNPPDNDADTRAAARRQCAKRLFNMDLNGTFPSQVYWHDVAVMAGQPELFDVNLQLTREIIWDSYEHSFRFELRALDRLVCPELWASNAAAQDQLIMEVFGGSYTMAEFPVINEGLAAEQWVDRVPALEHLRRVVVRWKNPPMVVMEQRLHVHPAIANRGTQVEALEVELAKFYCQTFFSWFNRAPVLPHRLPPPLE
ncbi:hypothetical protein PLICRDRAFT_180385 [Plicaturopsis crispa FD-325 SS-3]|uniref:Uncharacterized protein n=1 Tax=Plicaturopsis crispa FD-325 SS-3 TaxID=944288 RepID=A0A0C9SKC2_PLICR|nr:hypothetical protein PLICRDRAFT_180385 [Plicaturopsis crispa FD-325 SS-3]